MARDLKILDRVYLRGPNRWSYRPALEALVDIGELEESPSNTIDGFVDRLKDWLPGLIEHECSYGERGGFLKRLEEGTWPGHILEHVTLELQTRAGYDAGYGRARSTSKTGVYWVVVRITHEELTYQCLLAARELILAAMNDEPFDVKGTIQRLEKLAEDIGYGPSTAAIVDAARRAKIPTIRLAQNGNLVLLGHGVNQRRIWTAETDRTSAIAEGIARDKDLSKKLVHQLGIPVPEGTLVRSEEEAVEAAEDIGGTVVVKPRSASRGQAVSLKLSEPNEIREAYRAAREFSSAVVVEKYIEGDEHRLLVIGSNVVALTKAAPVRILGDGRSALRALLERELDREVARPSILPQDFVELPTVQLELRLQNLTWETVIPSGSEVVLHRSGKFGVDALSEAHPELLYQAALAVRAVGLDIAGVDLVTKDLSRPLRETGGAIIEINAGPSLLPHLRSSSTNVDTVGDAIIRELFPAKTESRIPLVGVTGSGDITSVTRLIGFLAHLSETTVGVTCRTGLYLGARRVDRFDGANFAGGQRLLINRTIQTAVIETTPESLLREGLPYDLCSVGVVTRVLGEPSLEKHDVLDEAQVAHILRTQIDIVMEGGVAVLNSDDELVANMAQYSKGEVVYYGRGNSSVLTQHVQNGGRAVTVGPQGLLFSSGSKGESFRVDTLVAPDVYLPAAAAAWALEIPTALIVSGILGYRTALLAMDEPSIREDRASSPNL